MNINPFKFGTEVSGDDFCNRELEIAELTQDIRNSANVLLYSPRRFGKTSLIKRVLEIVAEEGFLTVYIDLYPAVTKEKFIEIYARAVSMSVKGNMEKVVSWIREAIPKLIPKVVVRTEGFDLEFEFDKSQPYSSIYGDLFQTVHKRTKSMNKRAVVVFDEFQEIRNYPDDEVEREMRSAFQTHSNISYIYMGSKRHIMQDMFENQNRPFYRSAKHIPLQKIDKSVFTEFIFRKFQKGGYSISRESISEILTFSECHPFHTQQLCYYLWDQEAEMKEVTHNSINSVLMRLLEVENQSYVNLWDSFTQKQRELLIAISRDDPSSLFSNEFLQKHLLGTASSIQKAIKLLVRREILLKENGRYIFEDVFFKRWVLATFM